MNDLDHRPYLADTLGRGEGRDEAPARGEDVGPAVAELRAELVEDMGRTLGRLSGPHALVEVARLAGVGSRAN